MRRTVGTTGAGHRLLAVTAVVLALVVGSTTGAASAAPSAAGTPGGPAAPSPVAAAPAQLEDGQYVVLMTDAPALAYTGRLPGIPATRPAPGEKFSPGSPATASYRSHLRSRQDAAIARAGVPGTKYRYTDAISGFAADLTAAQAAALAKDPTVLAVTKDELYQLDTNTSPDFLGLTGSQGIWNQLGGTQSTATGAGAGVVVGVIDSGIWPESPSFDGTGFAPPTGWNGSCQRGPGFDPKRLCNNKLIGAKYFLEGFGRTNLASYERVSPRDVDGHGTHTASTAAGNDGVEAVIDGRSFGTISGMAPQARVAAYKVCWDGKDGGGGCFGSDSAAAIDAAVADGVDVLNFSISGTSDNYLDAVELGFMYAADAGIFVAASAGNDGPGASTVNHPSPWLTTVAAATHTIYEKTLLTGDGQRFIGSSITAPLPDQTPMVLSEAIPAAGVDPAGAALCLPGSLDAAKAAGALVVCDRGVNARVEKSQTVGDAGGAGMVLVNTTPGSLDNDLHAVPTVHLPDTARPALRAYVMGASSATGAILDTNAGSTTQVPEVAGFSSRGPSLGAGGDVLKPDVAAPGVGVLAAYSPRATGRSFDFLSGTSMSAPHVAGLAALLTDAHPQWSPMAMKSAMMTTARDHASARSNDLFAGGAGFVEPREFLDPGLVYDAGQDDWWAFLAGQGVTYSDGTPVSATPVDASDLNQASIAVGALAGTQTLTRTVRNVSAQSSLYQARVTGLDGVDVDVTPSRIRLRPGQSATFTVTFTSDGAPFDVYAQGHLTWSDGRTGHVVRSPLAVRPVAAAAPAEVSVTTGPATVEVVSGFAGTMGTQVAGLSAGTVTAATAQNTGGAAFDPADPRNARLPLSVPAGTTLTRVELVANDPVNDDLDLFVLDAAGRLVLVAASGAANERVTTFDLPPGDYVVHVQAWAVAGGAASTTFDVRMFTVPTGPAGNLSVDPPAQSVTTGGTASFTLAPGALADRPYLGWVAFTQGTTVAARTVVSAG